MEIASNQASSICNHCDKAIPSSNIDLHYAHCSRNLEKCNVCGDMVPIKLAEEHFSSTHALVSCTLCSETMERESLALHKDESCSRRILTCDFCEFPLPAVDLIEHQEVCGSRTEYCHVCRRYIRLREKIAHESMCTGATDDTAGTSSDGVIPSSNIDLPDAPCSRNLENCKVCGDMVPRKRAEEHFLSTHAPVSCPLCSEAMEREILAVHKGEHCLQRILTCDYCELVMPAFTLNEHQEVCGNRTEQCHMCGIFIRLHEKILHESRCNEVSDDTDESSRNTREVEKEPVPQPRQPHEFLPRPLLFTVTITSIAVLLTSLFFQRKK